MVAGNFCLKQEVVAREEKNKKEVEVQHIQRNNRQT